MASLVVIVGAHLKEVALPIIKNASGLNLSQLISQLETSPSPEPNHDLRSQGKDLYFNQGKPAFFCDSGTRSQHRKQAIDLVTRALAQELQIDLFSAERHMLLAFRSAAVENGGPIPPLSSINWQQLTELGQMVACKRHFGDFSLRFACKLDQAECLARRGLSQDVVRALANALPLQALQQLNAGLQRYAPECVRSAMAHFPHNSQRPEVIAALKRYMADSLSEAGAAHLSYLT